MTGLLAGYSSIAASNAAQPVAFGRTMRRVVGVCVVVCVVEYLWYASYPEEPSTWAEYAAARDTMVMLVVGFGFLMTFLRLYGLGAVGYTYLLTALVVLWAIPVEGFFERVRRGGGWASLEVGVPEILSGEFAAAAVLISYGAVLGKASVDQLAVVAVLEVVCYAAHKQLVLVGLLDVEDVGGSLSIHLFGAYFGLGCAWALGPPKDRGAAAEGADAKSDVLASLAARKTTGRRVFRPSRARLELFTKNPSRRSLLGSSGPSSSSPTGPPSSAPRSRAPRTRRRGARSTPTSPSAARRSRRSSSRAAAPTPRASGPRTSRTRPSPAASASAPSRASRSSARAAPSSSASLPARSRRSASRRSSPAS